MANFCRSCKTDFASVTAFDRHRTGVHEYLFADGLLMEPHREDGRRCLSPNEMLEAGMEVDDWGRWRIAPSERQKAFYEQNSPALSPSEGEMDRMATQTTSESAVESHSHDRSGKGRDRR